MSENNLIRTENPKEIASVVRGQTFGIANALDRAKGYADENSDVKPDSPLKFYSVFSRFPVVIINEQKKAVTGNIPVTDIADIVKRSNFIYEKHMQESMKIENTDLSPAYTVKISSGKLKGKTPAEVLIEDPDNKQLLNQQYVWLQKNLDKYPKNQIQMDAIEDAANLLKEGTLDKENVNMSSSRFNIYKSGTKPLKSRPMINGKNFIYDINIEWFIGDNYPVNITIQNYYAPVIKDKETNMNNVMFTERDKSTHITNEMKLTAAEWMNVLEAIDRNMRTFEMLNATECYKEASKIDWENRAEAKEKNNAS